MKKAEKERKRLARQMQKLDNIIQNRNLKHFVLDNCKGVDYILIPCSALALFCAAIFLLIAATGIAGEQTGIMLFMTGTFLALAVLILVVCLVYFACRYCYVQRRLDRLSMEYEDLLDT